MWTMKFQMFKLVLEKAEEPEIKLQTSIGLSKKQEFQKNIYFCFIACAKAFGCVDHNKLWKILKEVGILDHLTCLLRNLYAGQETTVRTGHGTTDWFQIGTGVHQGCILSSCLFNLYAEYIMRNAELESRLPGEISITSDMQMTPPLWQKWRGTKELLDESEEESEKVGLKLNIQKMKIMASSPITPWEIDGETVETVSDFILGGSKITADGDYSHEIKRCLFLGRKSYAFLSLIRCLRLWITLLGKWK